MKYYLTKVICEDKSCFLVWYGGHKDGFLVSGKRLLAFSSAEEADGFARKEKISFEAEETTYDFSGFPRLTGKEEPSEKCRIFIDAWNFFSDLSKSLDESFLGDSGDEITNTIYNKLFHGCNLEALKTKEYHPVFDDNEIQSCSAILLDGLAILKKQLNWKGGAGMVKHIILWKLKDTVADKERVLREMKENLEALTGKVPGLLRLTVVTCPLASSNADVMLDSELESEEALKGYQSHPEHVRVANTYVRPFTELRLCMDYEEMQKPRSV